MEGLAFTGLIFGWASLVHVFKQEGIYGYLCQAPNLRLNHILVQNITVDVHSRSNGTIVTPTIQYSNGSKQLDHFTDIFQNKSIYNRTMIRNSIYADVDEHSADGPGVQRPGCVVQDEHFSQAFSLSFLMFALSTFPAGFLFDRLGMRITRTIGW